MIVLNRTSLALALALCAFAPGCDEDGRTPLPQEAGTPAAEAGTPSPEAGVLTPDASTDAGPREGGTAAPYTCNSFTPPTATLCGGSHCQETQAELKAGLSPSGACKTDMEVSTFCNLKAVNEVRTCAVSNFGNTMAGQTCARQKLPEVSPACLQCYLDSAECAGNKCLLECFMATNESNTGPCDACRVAQGCISSFYSCAGFRDPIPQ